MSKSFMGKGYALQSKLRSEKRWSELTPEQQYARKLKAANKQAKHNQNLRSLIGK